MQFNGMILCDFCFAPLGPDNTCDKCGLSHKTYQPGVGLLRPGTILNGKYIIGKTLGRGGFGATYLAYSAELDKVVAIKEYLPVGAVYRGQEEETVTAASSEMQAVFEKGAKRFYEEACTISKFSTSKNIVSIHEFFYANNTVYYSMEYLEGQDLKKYIAQQGGRLDEHELLSIMKSVCSALMILHRAKTLHRDISPDNIFMCSNGDIKLIDFGSAKQVISNEHQSYSIVFKQGYAPLEQYTRKGNQGTWTDIYAFGATMYYALTGNTPPNAIDRSNNPNLDFENTSGYSGEIISIIVKCMEMNISDRYQNAAELMSDLKKIKLPEKPKPESDKQKCEVVKKAENNSEKQKKSPSLLKKSLKIICLLFSIALALVVAAAIVMAVKNINFKTEPVVITTTEQADMMVEASYCLKDANGDIIEENHVARWAKNPVSVPEDPSGGEFRHNSEPSLIDKIKEGTLALLRDSYSVTLGGDKIGNSAKKITVKFKLADGKYDVESKIEYAGNDEPVEGKQNPGDDGYYIIEADISDTGVDTITVNVTKKGNLFGKGKSAEYKLSYTKQQLAQLDDIIIVESGNAVLDPEFSKNQTGYTVILDEKQEIVKILWTKPENVNVTVTDIHGIPLEKGAGKIVDVTPSSFTVNVQQGNEGDVYNLVVYGEELATNTYAVTVVRNKPEPTPKPIKTQKPKVTPAPATPATPKPIKTQKPTLATPAPKPTPATPTTPPTPTPTSTPTSDVNDPLL